MTNSPSMVPLLAVALIIWAGVWAFVWSLDRKVVALERKLDDIRRERGDSL